MESSGPQYAQVIDRLTRNAVARARERGVVLVPQGQDALGELASSAALALQDQGLMDDEPSIARAEQSLLQVVDALPTPGVERRGAKEGLVRLGAADVGTALRGLCPGLWPFC